MKIGIIGAGVMGSGIAQVITFKHNAHVFDTYFELYERSRLSIEASLDKEVSKNLITVQERSERLSRLRYETDLSALKDCEVIIEAISEKIDLKHSLFKRLDEVCDAHTIFATNTSSLSISEISMATKRPHQVLGMHFFNPVPMMKLIEVIEGPLTDSNSRNVIEMLARDCQKDVALVKEAPGFIVNRILIPMINEAIACYNEGVASIEHIDQAMKLGANLPMGPLALGDLIGLDVCLAIMETLHRELGDKHLPHPLLRKMVRSNLLGRKTKQGFYTY
jgi:3-hydroxybutyryl-CoA dehydrogenase